MSSKRQITCNKTNIFWTNLIKRRWQDISRMDKVITNITKDKIREEINLINFQIETPEYYQQKEKINRLTIMIKIHYEVISFYFESIKNISTILTETTC